MSRNFLNDSARLARFRGERPSSAFGSRNIRIETLAPYRNACALPMPDGVMASGMQQMLECFAPF